MFLTLQEIYNTSSKAILTFDDGFCGGVYLGGKTIITSAHCVANKNPKFIYLGVTEPGNVNVQKFRAVKVSKYGKNYNFFFQTFSNTLSFCLNIFRQQSTQTTRFRIVTLLWFS